MNNKNNENTTISGVIAQVRRTYKNHSIVQIRLTPKPGSSDIDAEAIISDDEREYLVPVFTRTETKLEALQMLAKYPDLALALNRKLSEVNLVEAAMGSVAEIRKLNPKKFTIEELISSQQVIPAEAEEMIRLGFPKTIVILMDDNNTKAVQNARGQLFSRAELVTMLDARDRIELSMNSDSDLEETEGILFRAGIKYSIIKKP